MPGIATGLVSYLGDICGTGGDIQDTAHLDVLFIALCSNVLKFFSISGALKKLAKVGILSK